MRYDNNKYTIIKYFIFTVSIVIASLLQNSNGAFPEIFGARAFLLIPLTVVIAMHEREIPAALFGAFSGVLWDICSLNDGFNTLTLMIISAVCSVLISHLMRKNIITAFVLSGGAVLVYSLIYVLFNIVFSGGGSGANAVLTFYIPSCIYTLAFVPVMYFFADKIYFKYKRS